MKSKFLTIIENLEDISKLKNNGITKFLYPLKFFSIGFNKYFDINEIKEDNSYIYINKMMTNVDLDNLKNILNKIPNNIKGIVFDDLGVIELIKDLKIEKILFNLHHNLSYDSVNAMLDFVDTVVLSPDITLDETNEILEKSTKKLSIYGFGYLNVSYSKRKLNTNYSKYHDLENKNKLNLKNTEFDFISIENEDGTVFYYNEIFSGLNENYNDNIKYVIINLFNVPVDKFLDGKIKYKGFLEKETIYKLKGGE